MSDVKNSNTPGPIAALKAALGTLHADHRVSEAVLADDKKTLDEVVADLLSRVDVLEKSVAWMTAQKHIPASEVRYKQPLSVLERF